MITFEDPFLKPGEKLICFGDSLTHEGVYVKELQRLLPDNAVINAGRGGDKTPWALTRFQKDVLDVKPDALLIFLGTNDAAIGRGSWADEPMVPPQVYSTNLVWMTHLAKLKGLRKISIATPLGSFEGPAYLMHGDFLRDYCQAARDAASLSGSRLVPLDAWFWETRPMRPLTELQITRDGTHPTEDSYKKIAGYLAKSWGMIPAEA